MLFDSFVCASANLLQAPVMRHGVRAGRFTTHEMPDAQEEDANNFTPEPSGAARSRGTDGDLNTALRRLEGKSYAAFHDIEGAWSFTAFTFILDRAQSDPYAAPSRCRVKVRLPMPNTFPVIPPALPYF